MRSLLPFVIALVVSLPAAAANPVYHLELEATPEAAFPYLGRFGKVDLHVYASGVRGEALWLHGFSTNGSPAVTVANPLARMYVDVQTSDIPSILTNLAGDKAGKERKAKAPRLGPALKGKVRGIDATRYRLIFGKKGYVDIWTTDVIPPNAQLRTLVNDTVKGIAPAAAATVAKLPGTPLYVELNFTHYQKVAILKLKKLSFTADDEKDALKLGPVYVRAGILEKLFQ